MRLVQASSKFRINPNSIRSDGHDEDESFMTTRVRHGDLNPPFSLPCPPSPRPRPDATRAPLSGRCPGRFAYLLIRTGLILSAHPLMHAWWCGIRATTGQPGLLSRSKSPTASSTQGS